jgi:hypothetical protein
MRNHDLSSPNAAEMYFNDSIFGQLYTVLAETLGGRDRRPARRAAPADTTRAQKPEAPKRSLLERLDAWFWRQAQKDREAYLARSRDVFELERRVEALDRGALSRYY